MTSIARSLHVNMPPSHHMVCLPQTIHFKTIKFNIERVIIILSFLHTVLPIQMITQKHVTMTTMRIFSYETSTPWDAPDLSLESDWVLESLSSLTWMLCFCLNSFSSFPFCCNCSISFSTTPVSWVGERDVKIADSGRATDRQTATQTGVKIAESVQVCQSKA